MWLKAVVVAGVEQEGGVAVSGQDIRILEPKQVVC